MNYYISTAGNDENDGTSIASAWRTIAKVNSWSYKPGDAVFFEGGKTFIGSILLDGRAAGTEENPVVIGTYGNGRATIQAGYGYGVKIVNAGGFRVENLILAGSGACSSNGSGVAFINTFPENRKLEHICIRNIEAFGFGRKSILSSSGEQVPEGCGIFVGGAAVDGSKSGFSHVRIENCSCHHNQYYGILITGYWQDHPQTYANSDVYVGFCSLFDNEGDYEYLHNHSGSGLLMEDVDGGLVEYCKAYSNGSLCRATTGGPCGIWAAVSNRVIIQHCESYKNNTQTYDGDGFDLDGGTTNSILQYNYSHDNEGSGYLLYTYGGAPWRWSNNTVRYCISINDATKNNYYGGITCRFGDEGKLSRGVQVYNNIIINQRHTPFHAFGQNFEGGMVCNNIFISEEAAIIHGEQVEDKYLFRNNCYWNEHGFLADIDGKEYRQWEEFTRATGLEMVNGEISGFYLDPLLDKQTCTLSQESPVLGKGADLETVIGAEAPNHDYFGNPIPQGGPFCLGIHQL